MKAGFVLTAGDPLGYAHADYLMRSIRRHMPGVDVVQFTDQQSPALVGVDEVRRFPAGPLAVLIAQAYASCHGDWLLIDTDAVVQQDVRHLFAMASSDVMVAERQGTYIPGEEGSDFMARMPFNAGVVFSTLQYPWHLILDRVQQMVPEEQRWLGVQMALNDLIREGQIAYTVLPAEFNYPPKSAADDVRAKAVVHYKGPWRKGLLRQRIWEETCTSAS